MMYPVDSDWTKIAQSTGDAGWNATQMRSYWQKLENCQYVPTGAPYHGFSGWLSTNRADEQFFFKDDQCYNMVKASYLHSTVHDDI
jgi:choline dehydrogenase